MNEYAEARTWFYLAITIIFYPFIVGGICKLHLNPSQKKLNLLKIGAEENRPKILSVRTDDDQRTILKVRAPGIGVEKFQGRKGDLQAAFNKTVESISAFENAPQYIEIVLSTFPLPRLSLFDEHSDKLKEEGQFLIGQSRQGSIVQKITELPHLLVAGTTGSGKSTFFKQALLGLMQTSPKAKFYLIDLKRGAEFRIFTSVPGVKFAKTVQPALALLREAKAEMNSLAQSELFGHEPGAFTGANKIKVGYFELANGGTLFLDEVGDASPEMQLKLLKVIDEREFQRVGGTTTIKTSARVIFATNKNLPQLVQEGKFREDLYARISAFVIEMPSLERRKEDIVDILNVLIAKANKDSCTRKLSIALFPADLIAYFSRGTIPGNIRGIENDLHRLLIYSSKLQGEFVDVQKWKNILNPEFDNGRSANKRTPTTPLTFKELLVRETDLLGGSFPGLHEFLDLLETKVYQEADKKSMSVSELAKYLNLHRSRVSRVRKARRLKFKGGIENV